MLGVTVDMYQKYPYVSLERVFHVFDEKKEEIPSSNVDRVCKFEVGEILVHYSVYLLKSQI